MTDFRKKFNFEERNNFSKNSISKYGDKIPIYLSFDKEIMSIIDPLFKKNINKYIVTPSLTIMQFLSIVKKKLNIKPEESLTLFIEIYNKKENEQLNSQLDEYLDMKSVKYSNKITEEILCPVSASIDTLYLQYKDLDGFLYLRLIKENVFG
jgi:hypothetical protein